jgi:hypothetical protein
MWQVTGYFYRERICIVRRPPHPPPTPTPSPTPHPLAHLSRFEPPPFPLRSSVLHLYCFLQFYLIPWYCLFLVNVTFGFISWRRSLRNINSVHQTKIYLIGEGDSKNHCALHSPGFEPPFLPRLFSWLGHWASIFKRLWSSGIDSKASIPPAYVAWRAGTITLFLLGAWPPSIF